MIINMEGLTFTFNDEEIDSVEQEDNFISYGPLVQGIYDVEATFESEYGDATVEETIRLYADPMDQYNWITMDIPIANITFLIENYDEVDASEAYVIINDERLPISGNGVTEEIGPLLIDRSIEAKVITAMPWGEVDDVFYVKELLEINEL